MAAMSKNFFPLTKDHELLKSKDYSKVVDIVKKLWDSEVVQRSSGYCYSISDMMRTLLLHEGIASHIVECQLTVINSSPPGFIMLGYDVSVKNKEVPTHVVCVTDTEIPMIIDLSIGYIMPDAVPFVVERAQPSSDLQTSIAELRFENSTWHYTHKKDQYFPKFHQESIVERIALDRKVKHEIRWLRLLIVLAISVSAFNAARGSYDFYQTYVNSNNNFGPEDISRQDLVNKINNLEQLVRKGNEPHK
jgi:hypothetical protein